MLHGSHMTLVICVSCVVERQSRIDRKNRKDNGGHVQVKAGLGTPPAPHKQQQASAHPAPVINPVGASSNYTNKGLTSVAKSSAAAQGQGRAVAPPSSSHADSDTHVISGEHVDQARHREAKTAADEPPAGMNTSRLDKPGLSGPQENSLPGYQVINLLFDSKTASKHASSARDTCCPQSCRSVLHHHGQTLHHNPVDL